MIGFRSAERELRAEVQRLGRERDLNGRNSRKELYDLGQEVAEMRDRIAKCQSSLETLRREKAT